MTKTTRLCNKCGREIESFNDFTLIYQFGYESKFDGDYLNLDLCGCCLDEFVDHLIATCQIKPVIEN
jgi:hypothetical protein